MFKSFISLACFLKRPDKTEVCW